MLNAEVLQTPIYNDSLDREERMQVKQLRNAARRNGSKVEKTLLALAKKEGFNPYPDPKNNPGLCSVIRYSKAEMKIVERLSIGAWGLCSKGRDNNFGAAGVIIQIAVYSEKDAKISTRELSEEKDVSPSATTPDIGSVKDSGAAY